MSKRVRPSDMWSFEDTLTVIFCANPKTHMQVIGLLEITLAVYETTLSGLYR